ncbi:MAG: protein arginine kinase [Planctomycetota bacterium]|nr:MAG: protein arginine kinase [Planctomycetota bacterium]
MSRQALANVDWLVGEGRERDVVVSSRARLARNLADRRFLTKATRDEKEQTLAQLMEAARQAQLAEKLVALDIRQAPPLERSLLLERHIVSKQMVRGDEPRGVAFSTPDERLALMMNEEDHVRLQTMRPGLALSEAYEAVDAADDRLEACVEYAFSPTLGYLTACPTNVGTGVRFSVMLHLPALKLAGELEKVRSAARAMNLAVRGFYGEGSEATGDFYQISNQTTLGKSEREILLQLEERIVPQVVAFERGARESLLRTRRRHVEDRVFRALGLLSHARLLSVDEAMTLLSQARLGAALGLFQQPSMRQIHELMLLVQPAHLQKAVQQELTQKERKVARAELVRAHLARQDGPNGAP